jgi:hypothetical protein
MKVYTITVSVNAVNDSQAVIELQEKLQDLTASPRKIREEMQESDF